MSKMSTGARGAPWSLAAVVVAIECMGLAPAVAQPPSVLVQGERLTEMHRIVRYDDLNLAEQRGRDRLMRRVRYSIEDLCEDHDYYSTLNPPDRECESSGWSSAKPQLDDAFSRVGSSIAAASLLVSVQK